MDRELIACWNVGKIWLKLVMEKEAAFVNGGRTLVGSAEYY